jgi:hypothetical protein
MRGTEVLEGEELIGLDFHIGMMVADIALVLSDLDHQIVTIATSLFLIKKSHDVLLDGRVALESSVFESPYQL